MAMNFEKLTQVRHFLRTGDPPRAEQLARQLVRAEPADPQGRHVLANSLHAQGKLVEAVEHYREALRLNPNSAEAAYDFGIVCVQQNQFDDAISAFQQTVRLNPTFVPAHSNLAKALRTQNRPNEALFHYRQALALKPDDVDTRNCVGSVCCGLGLVEEAITSFQEALRLKPDSVDAHNGIGIAYREQSRLDEALAHFREAIRLRPDFVEAHNNLGIALTDLGRLAEALDAFGEALRLEPDSSAAHDNQRSAPVYPGRLEEAAAVTEVHSRHDVNHVLAHYNRSLIWLLQGDFRRGWPAYEWRWRTKDSLPRSFSQPRWEGDALAGRTILLHAEQGLGDTLQFIRYASLVKKRGGRVLVECQAPLLKLLTGCQGIDRLVPKGAALPAFDVHLPLLSLPAVFGADLDAIPAEVPYLHVSEKQVERWRQELASVPGFKVGIAWQGSEKYKTDRWRSLPLAQFERLARVADISLISLQKGGGAQQLAGITGRFEVLDLGSRLDEEGAFLDTSAVMKNLDLVITSDTSIAHLAGALGVQVWVALSAAPDWRWLLDREDSPWYPSMRLFRQMELGNWGEVFERIAQSLGELRKVDYPAGPNHVEDILRLAHSLHAEGKFSGAVEHYREVIRLDPDRRGVAYDFGSASSSLGNYDEAISSLRRAVQLDPDFAPAHCSLGQAFRVTGRLDEALFHLQTALKLKPDDAVAHNNLGGVFYDLNRLEEARASFREAARLMPSLVEAHNNLGTICREQNRLEEAVTHYREALRFQPNNIGVQSNLGAVLTDQGLLTEACALLQEVLRIAPDYVPAHDNLGCTLLALSRPDEALLSFQECLRLDVNYAPAHYNRSIVWLIQGDFRQGWPEYEWRWGMKGIAPRPFSQPRWDGSNLSGRTILLYAEQGFGDTLQFIRYAALIKQQGGTVVVECQRALTKFLGECPGIDQLIPAGSPLPAFDVQAPLLGLAGIFGTTLDSVPAQVPYLHASIELVERWRLELSSTPGFKVGIAWQGNTRFKSDRWRSLPLVHFERLSQVEGVRLFSLQKGVGTEQLAGVADRFPVVDLGRRLDVAGAFLDTAAVMKNLDLVITSDTSIAHLAGALGVPVWVALGKTADWRWLLDRDDCPWYPSMRLFRQKELGNWAELFDRIAVELSVMRGEKNRNDDPSAAQAESSASHGLVESAGIETMSVSQKLTPIRQCLYARDFSRAEQLARQLYEMEPANAEVRHLLANALHSQGKLAEAVEHYREAVRLDPTRGESVYDLGIACVQQGNLEEAISAFQRTVELRPTFAPAYSNLGKALRMQGRPKEALAAMRKAARLKPENAEAHNIVGSLCREQGLLDEGVASILQALRLKPDDAKAHHKLGLAYREQKRLDEALAHFREAVRCDPNNLNARNNLGLILADRGHLEEALVHLREAARLNPDHAEIQNNLGNTLYLQGRLDESQRHLQEALRLQPGFAGARNNLGSVLLLTGHREDALASYEECLRQHPDNVQARLSRSLLWLLQGDFQRGWPEYEWRWQSKELPPFNVSQPRWDGASLAGRTILLHAEQGLGDTLQFIRYASLVKQRGGTVLFACQASLTKFLSSCPGVDQQIPSGAPLPDFDVHAPLLSLPGIFGTTLEAIPAPVPYLHTSNELIAQWRSKLSSIPGFRVGIAWQGSSTQKKDRWRSIPLVHFGRLARIEGVQLISLQKGFGTEQLAGIADRFTVHDLGSHLDEAGAFLDTAAVMKNLDLVITSDTSIAHLAGALGVPVWVALNAAPDWRWLLDREDSPWYPSMRLFRQQKLDNWEEVFERIALELSNVCAGLAPKERPTDAVAFYNLGTSRVLQGRFDEATKAFESALQLQSDFVLAHSNLGVAFRGQGRLADALRHLQEAVRLKPVHAEAHYGLGTVHFDQGDLPESIAAFREAVRLKPSFVEAHNGLGIALAAQGCPMDALGAFGEALRLNPNYADAHNNRSLIWLLHGDFRQGWPESEWRWQTKECSPRSFSQPRWDGSTLVGRTILLHAEQGLGDTLQFVRYAAMVKKLGATVLVECQASLTRLLNTCLGIDQLVSRESSLPAFDVHVPLLSLPGMFGTTVETVPAEVPYLHAREEQVEQWRRELRSITGFKVGIAWQGSVQFKNDRWRSVPLVQFERLARVEGVNLISLQKGPGTEQLAGIADRFPVLDLGDRLDEAGAFVDTAAVMKNLDLVITSDTSIAHLAGALGVPVWVALSTAPDWRWLLNRDDSPWYPSMRLFRQQQLGNWEEVFERIAIELSRMCARSAPEPGPTDAARTKVAASATPGRPKRAKTKKQPRSTVGQERKRAEALYNRGTLCAQQGKLSEAISAFQFALQIQPDFALAHSNLGVAFRAQGRLPEALHHMREAVRLKPGHAQAHYSLGTVRFLQGHPEEAIAAYREAVRLSPNFFDAHNALGITFAEMGRPLDAESAFRQAVRLQPNHAEAHNNLGLALSNQRRLDEALPHLKEAIRLDPTYAAARNNLGVARFKQGHFDRAIVHLQEAIRLDPKYSGVHVNLGSVFLLQGRLAEALAHLEESLRLNPHLVPAHYNRSLIWLLQGNFRQGWPEFEWRWRTKEFSIRSFPQPRWDGSALVGRTILLHAEQGLGDTLQFVRYAAMVKKLGGTVLVECQAPLAKLLSTCLGIDQLIPRGSSLPAFDVQLPFLSLPGIFGTMLETMPAEVPYLHAREELVEQWRGEFRSISEFKVGIAWQGSVQFKNDRWRSVPLVQFECLARVKGVKLISLQKGPGTEQLAGIADRFPVLDLGDRLDEAGAFLDTAAVMKNLDLVITSDTSIAHLAGALGVPVWVALSAAPDWRWLLGRDDSPWYPSMRLFRQQQLDNWEELFERIALELSALCAGNALEVAPTAAAVSNTVADSHPAEDKLHEPEQHDQERLRSRRRRAEAYYDLGTSWAVQGKFDEAIKAFENALRLHPDFALAHSNLGASFRAQGRLAEALHHLHEAVRLKPDHAEAHYSLGTVHFDQGHSQEAIAAFREAVRLKPSFAEAHNSLGVALAGQGSLVDAQGAFREALRLNPNYPEAHNSLGVSHYVQGHLDEALIHFCEALGLNPNHADAHNNRSLIWLLKGDFEQGWPEAEWRLRTKAFSLRPFPQPRWDGSSLVGRTILLHAEQGLGDTLQFVRYAAMVKKLGATVLVECQASLTKLLSACQGIDYLIPAGNALPAFDVHVPFLSLPGMFGTTVETVPAEVPYLHAREELVEQWRREIRSISGFKVGIAWQGSAQFKNDRWRSVPLSQFERLARVKGVKLISLQKGPGTEQLAGIADRFPVLDLGDRLDEAGAFVDTAAVMKNLDLVITSDTSIAHLAGALGVPVWVALNVAPDWRWLLNRDDSPWYPSMRLFRQQQLGNWEEVFERIALDLNVLVQEKGKSGGQPAHHRADVNDEMGIRLVTQGRLDEAIDVFEQLLRDSPNDPAAMSNLGNVLRMNGRLEEAAVHLREAVRLSPDDAEGHYNLGIVHRDQRLLEEAVACYQEALRLKPDHADALNNLGLALTDLDRLEEAIVQFEKALRLRPDHPGFHNNLGIVFQFQGRLKDALACLNESLRLNPDYADARFVRSIIWLIQGNCQQGWPEYEWRWRDKELPPRSFSQPRWDGASLAGRTILLYAEQGLGDTLQFIRYATLVKQRGGTVLFECPAALTKLASTCLGIDQLIPQGTSLPAFDVQVPLLSLPRIFGTTLENVPSTVPYLHVRAELVEQWRREVQAIAGFKVGIVWQGNPAHTADRRRSVPLRHFERLAQVEGVRLISLQKGHGTEQLVGVADRFPVLDLGSRLDEAGGFLDTAAVMKNLDLVITSDTSIAHLAGALGVPVWVALSATPDWRWLLERDDSPWYPSMRLFRQKQLGNWAQVFERIALELGAVRARARQPVRFQPNDVEAQHNLKGIRLASQGSPQEAIAAFRVALRLNPNYAEVYNNLAITLRGLGRLEEAIASYRQALDLDPNNASFHNNLGLALFFQGHPDKGLIHLREALRLKPNYIEAQSNLGNVLVVRGLLEESLASYEECLRLDPTFAAALWNRSLVWLLQGDFKRGWPEYEWRWQTKDFAPRSFSQPRWDGAPLAGRTILLCAEQGLGDTLQFIRYAALVKQSGGKVLFECQASLANLLSSCPDIDQLVPQGAPLPAFDVYAHLLSLPAIFGTTLDSVPAQIPYLHASETLAEQWRREFSLIPGFKVGIAWQGRAKNTNDRWRSLPLANFEALAHVEGVKLFSLQQGFGTEQLPGVADRFPVVDLGSRLDLTGAFVDTAAVMKSLDLVITSDTSIAHLAGALGVPVWVALGKAADWRWLLDRDDCPWYPSMRLFRQKQWGNWAELFNRIAVELSVMRSEKNRNDTPSGGQVESNVSRRLPERAGGESAAVSQKLAPIRQCLQTRDFSRAEQLARQLHEWEPASAEVRHLLANALHSQGKLAEAVEHYREAVRLDPTRGESVYDLGIACVQQGNLEEAISAFQRTVELRPTFAPAYNNLGKALRMQGRSKEALAAMREAARLKPENAEAHNIVGSLCRDQGLRDEGVASIREALRLKPDYAEAHNNLGLAYREQKRLEEALVHFREALRVQPNYLDARNNLGIVLTDQGATKEAITAFREILQANPNHMEALTNLGAVLLDQGQPQEAIPFYEKALPLNPNKTNAYISLGNALRRGNREEEALASFQEALRLQPDSAEALNNLGILFRDRGRLEEAIAYHQEALRFEPDYVEGHNSLGNAYAMQGRLESALECFRESLRLDEDYALAHLNQSIVWLLQGNFEQGWLEYDWRWRTKEFSRRTFSQPRWDGSELSGRTILLFAEQGLGDTLQFIRYANLVKQRGGTVVVECQPSLTKLLSTCPGIDVLVPRRSPLPAFAVQAPLLNLPSIFRTTLETVPAQVPYLQANTELVEHWRASLSSISGFKVGIVWQGNPEHKGDRWRSIPLARFQRLAQVPGIRLISFQKGPGTEQLTNCVDPFGVLDLGNSFDQAGGFVDSAAVMKAVDLVIAPDTATAHLAGALGVPVWVALSTSPDWRWMLDREDSPWYPSMRLFRQKELGNWHDVFERMALELNELVRGKAETLLPVEQNDAASHNDSAVTLIKQGRLAEAEVHLREALRLSPNRAETYNTLGLLHRDQRRPEESVLAFKEAIRLEPNFAEAYNNLGLVLSDQGRLEEAATYLKEAVRLKPDSAGAHCNLGMVHYLQGQKEEAFVSYRECLRLDPSFVPALSNLGLVLSDQGRLEEAATHLQEAIRRKPDSAGAHCNLGMVSYLQGRKEEALTSYGESLRHDPKFAPALWNRSLIWLLKGDFQRGWAEYEWRLQTREFSTRSFSQPRWDGSPLAGRTILLHAEQGVGDTLQFIRYATLVKQRGGVVLVECQVQLTKLLSNFSGIDLLVPKGAPLPQFDVHAPLLSLPWIFGTTLDSVPATVPYLHAREELVEQWRPKLRSMHGFKVGIAWQGNPRHRADRWRSLPLAQFELLAKVPDVRLISLQKGSGVEQINAVAPRLGLLELDGLDDSGAFLDTAAVMTHLDLVITSDTSIAHLAGALGIPVWVALSAAPDWRWLLGREDSPWYPSMRLFRQNQLGRWEDVFERIALELIIRVRLEDSVPGKRSLKTEFVSAEHSVAAIASSPSQDPVVAQWREAIRLNPNDAAAHNNLGIALRDRGLLAAAAVAFAEVVRLRPSFFEGHNNLGLVLTDLGRREESLTHLLAALRLKADSAGIHNNLGITYYDLGRPVEALAHFQKAVNLEPLNAEARNHLGNVLLVLGRVEDALSSYQECLRFNGENAHARMSRSLVWLLQGDFERGWREYEWRWRTKAFSQPPYSQPRWDGSPLAGRTILLHAEQGLGDTLQFIRYAALVKERGGSVVVACQPPLTKILTTFKGIDLLIPLGAPLPDFDVYSPLLSLPGIFGTTLDTVPADVPYLNASEELVEQWRLELSAVPGLKVGIAWQGSAQFRSDHWRSVPLALFERLARVHGISLISLQKGFGTEQLAGIAGRFPVLDLGARLDEAGAFVDTAAVMKNLDLVITSDTAIAHLAGALGISVWVAASAAPEWRWLLNREDSPWYPSMRLFRQRTLDSWEEVFERIALELRAKCGGRIDVDEPSKAQAKSIALEQPAGYSRPLEREPATEKLNQIRRMLQAGQFPQAEQLAREFLRALPQHAEGLHLLGNALHSQGRVLEAIEYYREAVHRDPNRGDAVYDLGIAWVQQGDFVAAASALERAVELKPNFAPAHYNRSLIWLLRGDFLRGWPEYEWRWQTRWFSPRAFSQPRWDGAQLAGRTILLHAEQGLGDTLQFIRYAALVKQRGGTVLLACQPPLKNFLETCQDIDQLIPLGTPLPAFDVQAPLLSLPGIFGTTLETVPAPVPYLHAREELIEQWRLEFCSVPGFKVGIAWQGNPKHGSDRSRSVPLFHFARLGRVEGVSFVSLQKGFGTDQLADVADRFPVQDLGGRLDEKAAFLDTAAVMKNLDLVITSDTSIAHLAGALGVPVWVALSAAPDWRWLLDRDDSPWYPSMRVFRQRQMGNWEEVFERIALELRAHVRDKDR